MTKWIKKVSDVISESQGYIINDMSQETVLQETMRSQNVESSTKHCVFKTLFFYLNQNDLTCNETVGCGSQRERGHMLA